MKNISFDNPYLLLLIIPLLALLLIPFFIAIRKENKSKSVIASLALHIVIALLVNLALSGIKTTAVITETHVYVVADVSYSANRNLEEIDEYIAELQKSLPKNSKLGVVCFGKTHQLLTELGGELQSVANATVNTSATNIADALDYTSTLFGEDAINRIVLITDGKDTGNDATGRLISSIEGLYAKGIAIDAVFLDDNLQAEDREIQISGVDYTASTYLGRESTADVLIRSNRTANAIAMLYADGTELERRAVTLTAGYNIINFDLPVSEVGTFDYRVIVSSNEDTSTFNNSYSFTQRVTGTLDVLLISQDPADLERAQSLYGKNATIDAYVKNPNVPCSIEALCKYDEILLSNFDIRELNNVEAFLDAVDKAVSVYGKSLVTMGDLRIQNKTDDTLDKFEDMLPVKFGNNDQDPRLYAIVVDTSRSMENFSRLAIAKQAAIQLLGFLGPNDMVMIVNFWGEINVLQAPTLATDANKSELVNKINAIEAYQGTVIGTALQKAGELMKGLPYADMQVMLISDGMSHTLETDIPSEVVADLYANGITTSVIHPAARPEGISTLQGIAAAGGGEYYEIIDEKTLRDVMFAEIADDVTESVIEKDTAVEINRTADRILDGISSFPNIAGYAYAKAKASASTVLTVKYEKSGGTFVDVPLYAYWSYGEGKVASFTGTFTGAWTGQWQGSVSSDRFFTNLLQVNTPDECVDYPFTVNVDYDGTDSRVEMIPSTLDPYAKAKALIILPNGNILQPELIFDSSKYFYEFATPIQGKYEINITYSSNGETYQSQSVFNVSYSPEYDSFTVFDPAGLHAAIRNRGTVSEGVLPSMENQQDDVATYTVRFTVPLMIAAVVLYIVDIIIRKLKWNDIRSFFRKKTKLKGGYRS